jgi:hypothetical protein
VFPTQRLKVVPPSCTINPSSSVICLNATAIVTATITNAMGGTWQGYGAGVVNTTTGSPVLFTPDASQASTTVPLTWVATPLTGSVCPAASCISNLGVVGPACATCLAAGESVAPPSLHHFLTFPSLLQAKLVLLSPCALEEASHWEPPWAILLLARGASLHRASFPMLARPPRSSNPTHCRPTLWWPLYGRSQRSPTILATPLRRAQRAVLCPLPFLEYLRVNHRYNTPAFFSFLTSCARQTICGNAVAHLQGTVNGISPSGVSWTVAGGTVTPPNSPSCNFAPVSSQYGKQVEKRACCVAGE